MLVLSRKPGEKVVIGGNITITVVELKSGRTRIGIEAPADVIILRDELVTEQEGRGLATGLKAEAARSLERDVNGGQVGADQGSPAFRPELMPAAAIKAPLRRLRRVPR
jgi:carbon storage regulator